MKAFSVTISSQVNQILKIFFNAGWLDNRASVRAFQSELLRGLCVAVICLNFALNFLGWWATYQSYGIITLVALCVLLLNKRGHYATARLLFVCFIHFCLFYVCATRTHLLFPYLMLLAGVVVGCLLFFDDAQRQLPAHILLMLFVFVLFQVTDYKLPVTVAVTDEVLNRAFLVNIGCLLVSVVLSLLYLVIVYEKSEKNLRLTLAELQTRNEEMDQYVYRVSHDLRAPLRTVIGLTDLAADEEDPVALQAYVKLIRNTIQKSDDFIQSVLVHSKAMNVPVAPQRMQLGHLLQTSFDELQYLDAWPRVQFSVAGNADEVYYGDPQRLSMVVKNIIANAIQFYNPQVEQSWLRCTVHITDRQAVIAFADNGIGIEAVHLPRIFDMFYRGSERATGSGLGLYIARQALEKIAGRIQVQSQTGAGTTVDVTLKNYRAEAEKGKLV